MDGSNSPNAPFTRFTWTLQQAWPFSSSSSVRRRQRAQQSAQLRHTHTHNVLLLAFSRSVIAAAATAAAAAAKTKEETSGELTFVTTTTTISTQVEPIPHRLREPTKRQKNSLSPSSLNEFPSFIMIIVIIICHPHSLISCSNFSQTIFSFSP